MTNAEARFNKSLRPRKPEGSLGRTAQDVHLDSHTAPELWKFCVDTGSYIYIYIYIQRVARAKGSFVLTQGNFLRSRR